MWLAVSSKVSRFEISTSISTAMIFDEDGLGYAEGLRYTWHPEKLRILRIFKAEEDPMFNTSKDDIHWKVHPGSRDAH